MRNPANIHQAIHLGINWIGLIFYKKSPRFFEMENGKLKIENEKTNFQLSIFNFQLPKVGVFVNASIDEMEETALRYRLDYLQLHGNESPEVCDKLKGRGFALIKAFPIASEEDINLTRDYEGIADYFLFDTKCEGFGGSGESFDWSVLNIYEGKRPFLLSGGINPDSTEAIRNFHHPRWAGIDLNSGFETEPGLKDIGKLSHFIRDIRS